MNSDIPLAKEVNSSSDILTKEIYFFLVNTKSYSCRTDELFNSSIDIKKEKKEIQKEGNKLKSKISDKKDSVFTNCN